jgi:hypothetical protein
MGSVRGPRHKPPKQPRTLGLGTVVSDGSTVKRPLLPPDTTSLRWLCQSKTGKGGREVQDLFISARIPLLLPGLDFARLFCSIHGPSHEMVYLLNRTTSQNPLFSHVRVDPILTLVLWASSQACERDLSCRTFFTVGWTTKNLN